MNDKNGQPVPQHALVDDIWRTGGMTEHLGGPSATSKLLSRIDFSAIRKVLDVGCGTGYSAFKLSSQHDLAMTAIDRMPVSLRSASDRVRKSGLAKRVFLATADAHCLPIKPAEFDLALVESVLAFCDAPRTLSEIVRVLKPGGWIACNEITYRQPPPAELVALIKEVMGIRTYPVEEWLALLSHAGFESLSAELRPFRLSEQFAAHLEVDGLMGYLKGLYRGMANTRLSGAFINRRILSSFRRFMPMVGYGLYTGRKI